MSDHSPPDDVPSPQAKSPQTRKRRARLVCVLCHDKKIKCDLQTKAGQDASTCTNCSLSGSSCRLRPSQRGKRHRPTVSTSNLEPANGSRLTPLLYPNVGSPVQGLIPRPPASALPGSGNPPDLATNGSVNINHGSTRNHGPYKSQRAMSMPQNIKARDFPNPTPNRYTSGHPSESYETPATAHSTTESYLGETGFLHRLFNDRSIDPSTHESQARQVEGAFDLPPPALQESFAETFFEHCYTWCPVLEREELFNDPDICPSPLLRNALALLGSQIQPPVIKHASPAAYYDRAKQLFYSSHETNPITCIKAIILLYYWSPVIPTAVSMDSVWWWTGVAIRQAQQVGLHREAKPGQDLRGITPGMRRRIWWTLFARERLTGICQGRPCVIDPADCDIDEPTPEDFPDPSDTRAEIFCCWVRLCGIIGRVSQHLYRTNESSPFPVHLATELIGWAQSLPGHLTLPITANHTTAFNREVHMLHLPYLTTITILHLSRSSRPLPKAYTAAVLAASCIARIFEDYLARGPIRFLSAITCWYVAVATLALLHARQVEYLAKAADDDIRILQIALHELGRMWPVAKMFDRGIQRLLKSNPPTTAEGIEGANSPGPKSSGHSSGLTDIDLSNGVDWSLYFPFATKQTSALANIMLSENQEQPFPDLDWPSDFALQLQDLFDPSSSFLNMSPMARS